MKLALWQLGCVLAAVAMMVYVFTHPRCFTAAGTDFIPYLLFVVWCIAELIARPVADLRLLPRWRVLMLRYWLGRHPATAGQAQRSRRGESSGLWQERNIKTGASG